MSPTQCDGLIYRLVHLAESLFGSRSDDRRRKRRSLFIIGAMSQTGIPLRPFRVLRAAGCRRGNVGQPTGWGIPDMALLRFIVPPSFLFNKSPFAQGCAIYLCTLTQYKLSAYTKQTNLQYLQRCTKRCAKLG